MKNSFLFPFLFGSNSMGEGEAGFSMLKYKMMMGDTGNEMDEITKLSMFVPAAKNMIEATAQKLTQMDERTKEQITAATIVQRLADTMLEEDPGDELAATLRDVCNEITTQFVFSSHDPLLRRHERRIGNGGNNGGGKITAGAELVGEKKLGEDVVKSILIEGETDDTAIEERKRGKIAHRGKLR